MAERRRWTILAINVFAQAATCSFLYGVPMLIPALRDDDGLSLLGASALVAAPMAGLLITLIAWGALADRRGERGVIATGVGLAALLLAGAAIAPGVAGTGALLAGAGAAGAAVNAASGRMIMGWFPVHERGLAMGTRQTAQPLGVALASLVLPSLAGAVGARSALLFPAALCATAALSMGLFAANPPRPSRPPPSFGVPAGPAGAVTGGPAGESPYRGSWRLPRVHLASSLLVMPQFAVAAFTLVYLVSERGWDAADAGRLIFAFQFAGALGRIVAGVWSDRVGSRLRPMRQLALASAALMAALGVAAAEHAWWIVIVFGLAAVVSVADNGLGYTAVAEMAGTTWSGRALGVQSTAQNVTAVISAPTIAAIIGDNRYALAFALVAVFPLLAIGVTPVRAEGSSQGADDGQRRRGELRRMPTRPRRNATTRR